MKVTYQTSNSGLHDNLPPSTLFCMIFSKSGIPFEIKPLAEIFLAHEGIYLIPSRGAAQPCIHREDGRRVTVIV